MHKIIKLATGMYMDLGNYIQIGERGYTMERYINCKFGISAANDKLLKRLTDIPQDPNNPKTKVPLETMKKPIMLPVAGTKTAFLQKQPCGG